MIFIDSIVFNATVLNYLRVILGIKLDWTIEKCVTKLLQFLISDKTGKS